MNKQIFFTSPVRAELLDKKMPVCGDDEVIVRIERSTISSGTERANITGDPNVNANGVSGVVFPRSSGYNSAGTVVAVGEGVKTVAPGDRVVVFWGKHKSYNLMNEDKVVKICDPDISFETGAMSFIASSPAL